MSKPFSISLATNVKKPSSTSASSSQRPSRTASQSSTPRPGVFELSKSSRSRFQHDDSEGEDEHPPAHEEVTAFDHSAGGAIRKHKPEEKTPLVIKVNSKNNWRDRVTRARKSWLPSEVQAQRAAQEAGVEDAGEVEVEGPSTKYGLSYAQKSEEERRGEAIVEDDRDVTMADAETTETPAKPLTQEEQALQALISESKGESSERKSNLVIEGKRINGWSTEENETKSFRTDIASRPDSASLADYAAVPVEEFGAALLRGMGWKEGEPVNKSRYGDTVSTQTALKARVPERRPGYLGIGAKDISGKAGSSELELGAWGKSAMRKAKKPGEGLYTPVLMRSKKTGELITEDEFKKLQKGEPESGKSDEWKERRDRNLEKYGRDRRRRDDYDDEDDCHRSPGRSSRNASVSPGRERRRRKYNDDEDSDRRSGDRRYRDRSRDRDRDRRDRESDRERERRRDRDRDRGRDRDWDSDRDGRHKSSRRSPDEDSSRHRSSRRHDSDRDRDRRDRYGDRSRDRR